MDVKFETAPELFGLFHIIMLAAAVIVVFCFALLIRQKSERTKIRLLGWLGIGMLLAEVWKQWFSVTYIYPGAYNMWFFPWQLCSMAMYCSALIPLFKENVRNILLVFLATFSLLAAVMALLVPSDMLRPQILFALHGFLYHIVMLMESVLAISILKHRKGYSFKPALLLFLLMAVFAELLNTFGHFVLADRWPEPNMFQITLYYPTTQVVLSGIAASFGIIPEIIFYLILIIAASFGIYQLEKFIFAQRASDL